MEFKDRVSTNSGKKRLIVEGIKTDAGGNVTEIIISGTQRLDVPTVSGTKLDRISFLRALYDLQQNKIDVKELVEIQELHNRYLRYSVRNQDKASFKFNYLGPEIYGEIKTITNYFSTNVENRKNEIIFNFIERSELDNLSSAVRQMYTIRFYLKMDNTMVTETTIMFDLIPKSNNPND